MSRTPLLGTELARKAVHISLGGLALLRRYATPLQAAVGAAAAILFNLFPVEPSRLVASAEPVVSNLAWGVVVCGVPALAAYAVRELSASGAFAGWLLGTLVYVFAGWQGFTVLAVFVVLGILATRAGFQRKVALGIAQERGGRRDARHAFANIAVGAAFAVLAAGTAYPRACAVAMVAAFATAAADTAASEIGQAYGRRHYLVTTFRPVSPGTEGAVSLAGAIAGALASAILALSAWGAGMISVSSSVVVVIAAFAGTTLESYVAAIGGASGTTRHHLLNFANTLVGAVVALLLTLAFSGS